MDNISAQKKTVSEMIKEMAAIRGLTQKELAEKIGTSPQNLNGRLRNNAFTAEELRTIAGILGFSVEVKDDEKGSILQDGKIEEYPRLKKMIDGIIIDTGKAELICRANMAFRMCLELYKDNGGFFIVYRYGENNATAVRIDIVEAKRIFAAYGDQNRYEEYFAD